MIENHPANDATSWQSNVGDRKIPTGTELTKEVISKEYGHGRWDNYSYKTKALLKGKAAEQCCLRYFESLPDCEFTYHSGKKHEFDFTVIEDASEMPYKYFVECKLMSMSKHFKEYAINAYQYKIYRGLEEKYNVPFKVYFIDIGLGECRGAELKILDQSYCRQDRKGDVMFYPRVVTHDLKGEKRDWVHLPFELTNKIFDLLPAEIEKIKELCRDNRDPR